MPKEKIKREMNMERNENGFLGNSVERRTVTERGGCISPDSNGAGSRSERRNGRSGCNNGNSNSVEIENGACPGTGDMWRPDTEMSPDLLASHKVCSKHQLGMVYSPYQCWRMLYSVEDALNHGTLFEELYKPLEER